MVFSLETSSSRYSSSVTIHRIGGTPAVDVYRDFARYVEGLPLVAYNSDYDLEKVLKPEWSRLGIRTIGTDGLCALRLYCTARNFLSTARNLLSRQPHRGRSERGSASGSEGVWGSEGWKNDE